MLIDLVNRYGRPAGNVNVPDEIMESAKRVERWMVENNVREFCGLTAHDLLNSPARYQKTDED